MKTVKDKYVLVAADISGYPLKEAVVEHLKKRGWKVTDVGVQEKDLDDPEMFHRIGLRAGAMISEGEFEKALIFCGTGMGIHIAASKCPHVHCALAETIPAAKRSSTANNCNILSMGAFLTAPKTAMAMADAFLENSLGDGYENWEGFYEYHKLAYDELEAFDYEEYKRNGFKVTPLYEAPIGPEPEDLAF